ncbi:ceramide synthase 4-like [Phascolarctos cinereus]|uniref:Ceramide synthase 4-like n=1 Tax=Phascolarctos cinereus TaxID=38626 RepID=A0A6P5JHZ6_PHACI|nr:ceramide synthase 4-like [Phascolarctos cinereus]
MLATLYKSFWKTEYWLPPGYTWADLEDSDGITYPHPKDLLAAIPLTFVLLVVRYGTERIIGLPLSRALGVRDPVRIKATPNRILESFFWTQSKNPKKDELSHLASQCSLSVRQAERWFRHRRNQERPLLSKKFSESCSRFLFYSCSSFGGLLIFYNASWFGQPETLWKGYPKQPLQPAIYWWYILELSFYLSLLLTLNHDVKRKDFYGYIIHHFMAVSLISYSYSANFIYIGVLVMLLHDMSDVLLEAAKMIAYAKWKQAQNVTFILFGLVFFVTRLIFFPTKVIYNSYCIFQNNNQFFFGYYFCNALLMIAQSLNLFWFFLILKMFYKLLSQGQVKGDVRSDLEEPDLSDEQLTVRQQSNGRLQFNDATDIRARGVRGTGQLTEAVPVA